METSAKMSFWNPESSFVENKLHYLQDYSRKTYTKIDPIGKLHVIHALDNGQSKADIAREYGVHPQTIAYIYRQKESIIKKYTQKYNLKEVHCVNLDQTLLSWLQTQVRSGNIVTEAQLRAKAQEIVTAMSEEFTCIEDWLLDFRIRHNIVKFTSDIICSVQVKEEWTTFLKNLKVKDFYVGGTCALLHSYELDSYFKEQEEPNNFVSLLFIVNSLGMDKKELMVIGKELIDVGNSVKSLPVKYFYSDNPLINYFVIENYLKKWDNELKIKRKSILLLMNLPDDTIKQMNFDNIQLISTTQIEYFSKILEKIIACFKYNYRRLQITRKIAFNKDPYEVSLWNYINMMSLAWYDVSSKYIQHLFFPPIEGSLFFNFNDDSGNQSLSQWCKLYDIPLDSEMLSKLDRYICCDEKLQSSDLEHMKNHDMQNINNFLLQSMNTQSTSGMEAYQAMKRLVSYLQGENAPKSIVNSAKNLENHLEYGALLEMHQIIACTNDSE